MVQTYAAPLTTKGSSRQARSQEYYEAAFTNSLLVVLATVLLCQLAIFAQEQSTNASFSDAKEVIPVNVLVGQSRLITFATPLERFSVSNPDIAEAVLVGANQVVVNGKAFGQINFIAWEKGTGRFVVDGGNTSPTPNR